MSATHSAYSCSVSSYSTTSTTIWYYTPKSYTHSQSGYIMLCEQQWGLRLQSASTFVVAYPIAFSTQCYCVCLGNINEHTGTVVAHVANNTKVTQTQVEFASNHKNYYASNYWIALGCQQWGRSINKNTTWTYPLATDEVIAIMGMSIEGDWSFVSKITNTSLYNDTDCKASLAIIAKQQWGYKSSSSQREVINFPLTFTATIYAIICQNYFSAFSGSAGWFSSNVGSYTLSKTEIFIADKLGWWIAIGIQQWRYLEALSSKNTWTYPIAFLNFVIPITTRHYDHTDEQSTQEMAVTERSLTFCKILRGSSYTKGIFCYAVGVQWGMQSSQQSNGKTGDWAFPNSRNVSFTYPLKCNSTVAVIPMCRLNSPTSNNPAINMGAFYREATGDGFIHYSSISWEQTVTWYACYVAFCVQQWRFNYTPANSWEVWTFPIPFSGTTYFCYCCMQYADVSGKGWGHIYNKTALGCNLIMDRTTNDCFAIGKQQWGVNTTPVTFPLSYPNICLWVQPVYNTTSSESGAAWWTCYANAVTSTGFTNGANRAVNTRWYAIGNQKCNGEQRILVILLNIICR